MKNIVSITLALFLIFFSLKSFAKENDENFISNRIWISENYFSLKKDLLKSKKFNNFILKIDNLFLNISIEKLKEINSILKKIDENEEKYSQIKKIILYLKIKIKLELINNEITKQKIIPDFIKKQDYLKIENDALYCEFWDKNDKSPQAWVYYSKQEISIIKNPYLLEEINYKFIKDDKFIYRHWTMCTQSVPWSCLCSFSKMDLDLTTFEILDDYYFYKDKNNLYYLWEKVEWIDLKTFELIKDNNWETWDYIKDKSNIFYWEKRILWADKETFVVWKWEFLWKKYDAKDKNNYYEYWRKIYISLSDIKWEAIKKNNVLFCNNLKTKEDIESCKKSVSNNLVKKAIDNNNLSLCSLTLNIDYCMDKVYYNLAIEKKNIYFCKEIKWENKEKCFYDLSANWWCDYVTSENYKTRCIKIKDNIEMKKIYQEAIEKNIVEKCIYLLKNKHYYNKCMMTILHNSNDLDSCYRIFVFGDKVIGTSCYVNLAIKENNVDVCNKIDNKFYSDMCIGDFNRLKTK